MLEILKESLKYNLETGDLTWLERPRHHFSSDGSHKQFNSRFSGKLAGTVEKRKHTAYLKVNISGKFLYGHTIAWALSNGEFPDLIDHKDRNGLNNRLDNLRVASKSENALNVSSIGKLTGLQWDDTHSCFKAVHRRIYLKSGSLLDCAAALISYKEDKSDD